MPATFINMALILLGGGLGLLFKNLISNRLLSILTHALGLCVLGIGISSAIGTENMLCVIVCMVVGTVIGTAVDIERRLEGGGDFPPRMGEIHRELAALQEKSNELMETISGNWEEMGL